MSGNSELPPEDFRLLMCHEAAWAAMEGRTLTSPAAAHPWPRDAIVDSARMPAMQIAVLARFDRQQRTAS